jgi:hypothetical protein
LPQHQREQLAERARGKRRNWALPQDTHQAVPITRPIQVDCYADRLVIVSERGDRQKNATIMIPERTADVVEPLVAGVWERINSWGIAGTGMYWRPVLMVNVAPDGRGRYDDLEGLLYGSGLDMKQKTPLTAVAPPATNNPPR